MVWGGGSGRGRRWLHGEEVVVWGGVWGGDGEGEGDR